MDDDKWVDDTITLCKKEIPVKVGMLPHEKLRFYAENPRIYSIVCAAEEKDPPQSIIENKLTAMDHVKQLVQTIKANGGLTDPVLVRDGDYVVLEGNSRLAAYRLLAKYDAIKWGKLKCKLLPKDIDDKLVFAILGEYHIIGKKDWAPYEQAGYLYRRYAIHEVAPESMAQEMGLSVKYIGHLIEIYTFMVKHGDNNINRWSYYDEYLSHNPIKKARKDFPELDNVVVEKIKSGEIQRAIDVRENLTTIAIAGHKVLSQFISGKRNFEESYERAVIRGADNLWYKRLNKFRTQIADPDLKDDLLEMLSEHRDKCVFELKKIKQSVDKLLHGLE